MGRVDDITRRKLAEWGEEVVQALEYEQLVLVIEILHDHLIEIEWRRRRDG